MDPNNNNPSNTPPAEDVPAQPPVPEQAPGAPEVTPSPAGDPVATPTPVETPAAPFGEQPATPVEAPTPAPAPTPVTPEAPAAAAPSVFSTATGAPQAPKKSNKTLILILSIVGGVVLLGVIGFVLYSLFGTVSKEDYRDAARQFNKVSASSSALSAGASTLGYSIRTESDTTFDDSVKSAEDSIASLKTENDELSKLKAVRVGEGAKLYTTFNDKLKAYTANASEIITSVKNLRPALVTCNKVSDATDNNARVVTLKECSAALGNVKDVPNAQFKAYIESISKGYGEYATVFEQIAALSNPYGANYEQYKTLRDKMYDVQDTISEASKKFSSELKARDDELSVKDAANTLADYLTDQQKS